MTGYLVAAIASCVVLRLFGFRLVARNNRLVGHEGQFSILHLFIWDYRRSVVDWRRTLGQLEFADGAWRVNQHLDIAVHLDDIDNGIHCLDHHEPDSIVGMEVADSDPVIAGSWLRPLLSGNELNRRRVLFPSVWILVFGRSRQQSS